MTRETESVNGIAARESEQYSAGNSSSDKAPRVGRLDTAARIRSELAKLYREARRASGRNPDALTAYRLSQVLGAVARSLEVEELEARIAALEARTPTDSHLPGHLRSTNHDRHDFN